MFAEVQDYSWPGEVYLSQEQYPPKSFFRNLCTLVPEIGVWLKKAHPNLGDSAIRHRKILQEHDLTSDRLWVSLTGENDQEPWRVQVSNNIDKEGVCSWLAQVELEKDGRRIGFHWDNWGRYETAVALGAQPRVFVYQVEESLSAASDIPIQRIEVDLYRKNYVQICLVKWSKNRGKFNPDELEFMENAGHTSNIKDDFNLIISPDQPHFSVAGIKSVPLGPTYNGSFYPFEAESLRQRLGIWFSRQLQESFEGLKE